MSSNVLIMTDSNSGITLAEGKEMGVLVVPMPFYIDGNLYYEEIDLSQAEFYEKLMNDVDISTSTPIAEELTKLWDEALKEYEEIVYIPMSSGLSSSCEMASLLAQDYDGRVQVVNNQRISVTQRRSVEDALSLAKAGLKAERIKDILIETKFDSSIYIMVDTLKYLKKGGRLTPAVAAIGTLLRLKPVLQIQGEKLDTFSKARTVKQAKAEMVAAVIKDAKERFDDPTGDNCWFDMAYTYDVDAADACKAEVLEAHPNFEGLIMNPLSLSVSCHIGPGALAITATKKLKVEDWV